MRHVRLDPVADAPKLHATIPLAQAEMHADRVDRMFMVWQLDLRVKKTSAFQTIGRNVDVLRENDRVLAENRIAVMTRRIDGIFSVGKVRPDLVGQKLELRV